MENTNFNHKNKSKTFCYFFMIKFMNFLSIRSPQKKKKDVEISTDHKMT